jgi:dihydrofolate reductase
MSNSIESTPPTPESNLTMTPRELTLIVAATNKMGIGRAGTLPWTGLKKEMAYFARVTKRANPGVSCSRRFLTASSDSFADFECCDYGPENMGEHTTQISAIKGKDKYSDYPQCL